MKVKILDPRVTVYAEMDLNSTPLTQLVADNEVELGGVKKKEGKDWVAVVLPGGQKGYLSGETKIYPIKQVSLLQKDVDVYTSPSEGSLVKTRLKKGAKFYLAGSAKQDGKDWVKIREFSGSEGYIDGKTRIQMIPEVTKAVGRKNMIYGALWFFGGLIVTVGTYSAASSSGGTYLVTWGAIIFGAIQFLQGLYQYATSKA